MTTNADNKRWGFTIVELLVTIAIIVVLAALAFTLSRKAISSAQAAQCSNNMRQLAIAHVSLAQDYNGGLVHTWRSTPSGSWPRNWSQFHTIAANEDLSWRAKGADVNERMRSLDSLQCPTAAKQRRKEMATKSTHDGWRTYALNQRIGTQNPDDPEPLAWIDGVRTVMQVEDATKLILMTERAWDGQKYPAGCGPVTPTQASGFFDGHAGHTHVCYFDGHVESKKPQHVPIVGATLPNGKTVPDLGDPEASLIWRGSSQKK